MANYREVFNSQPPPKIPFLGMYLQDLTFIDDGNSDFLDVNIVNFDKRSRLHNVISIILHLQKVPYQLTPLPDLLNRLKHLKGFDNHHIEKSYELSKYIENVGGSLTHDDISDLSSDPHILIYVPNFAIITSPSTPHKKSHK